MGGSGCIFTVAFCLNCIYKFSILLLGGFIVVVRVSDLDLRNHCMYKAAGILGFYIYYIIVTGIRCIVWVSVIVGMFGVYGGLFDRYGVIIWGSVIC